MKKKAAKKTTPAKKDPHTEEIKRYVGVLSEDFQHRVSAIGEQFGGLNDKVDRIAEKLDEHGRKLDQHTVILNQHGYKLDEHGRILGEHGRKLDVHTQMIARVMEDVGEIKSGMREKVDRKDFTKLEKRVLILETMVLTGKKK